MSSSKLRLKLLKNGDKQHQCEKCQNTLWLGEKIPLELHHIDGNHENNELNNIQMLCPNCHTLTPNYRGRSKGKKINKLIIKDEDLINAISSSYSRREALLKCKLIGEGGNYTRINNIIQQHNLSFRPRPISDGTRKRIQTILDKYGSFPQMFNKTKIKWPEINELIDKLKTTPTSKIAREIGVSDSAIRKHIKKMGYNLYEISPWSKKHHPKMNGGQGGI